MMVANLRAKLHSAGAMAEIGVNKRLSLFDPSTLHVTLDEDQHDQYRLWERGPYDNMTTHSEEIQVLVTCVHRIPYPLAGKHLYHSTKPEGTGILYSSLYCCS